MLRRNRPSRSKSLRSSFAGSGFSRFMMSSWPPEAAAASGVRQQSSLSSASAGTFARGFASNHIGLKLQLRIFADVGFVDSKEEARRVDESSGNRIIRQHICSPINEQTNDHRVADVNHLSKINRVYVCAVLQQQFDDALVSVGD